MALKQSDGQGNFRAFERLKLMLPEHSDILLSVIVGDRFEFQQTPLAVIVVFLSESLKAINNLLNIKEIA